MTDQVFAIVKKHLMNAVEGLDDAAITSDRSMRELGANSLDIVEIVSASMRELRVKVPRSELTKLTDIGGLVALLQAAQAQAKVGS